MRFSPSVTTMELITHLADGYDEAQSALLRHASALETAKSH